MSSSYTAGISLGCNGSAAVVSRTLAGHWVGGALLFDYGCTVLFDLCLYRDPLQRIPPHFRSVGALEEQGMLLHPNGHVGPHNPTLRQVFLGMTWRVFGDVVSLVQPHRDLEVRHSAGYGSIDQVHVDLLPGLPLFIDDFRRDVFVLHAPTGDCQHEQE